MAKVCRDRALATTRWTCSHSSGMLSMAEVIQIIAPELTSRSRVETYTES